MRIAHSKKAISIVRDSAFVEVHVVVIQHDNLEDMEAKPFGKSIRS